MLTSATRPGVDPARPARLGDRYELAEPIGYGGMGQVYRAHDAVLDREVAIKLLDAVIDHDDVVQGSVAEARAVAKLTHPGIVHVFDAGTDGTTSYVVMELVPGRTLDELARERGMLAPSEAADIAAQVADALDDAHRHGIIHCDVKPTNIIVTPKGRAKLVDFGIARAAAVAHTLPADEIRGSAAYVAPEQARGEQVDGRTDVYSLGAVLYELLTGRPPFQGQTPEDVVAQRLVSDPPAPSSFNPRIPADLEAVVVRALAREPRSRYNHAADMRDALRASSKRKLTDSESDTRVIPRPYVQFWKAKRSLPFSQRRARPVGVIVAVLVMGVALAAIIFREQLTPVTRQGHSQTPNLVGHRLSEVSTLLKQAGFASGDTVVLPRAVDNGHVGLIVDQQPQPGRPLEEKAHIQIAVGVPQR